MGRPKLIADRDLLVIAREIFRRHGHTASTRQVAKAAGISQAALYKRFKDKDALFIAALSLHSPALDALSAIDPTGRTPQAYLALFGARAKDHFRQAIPSILSQAAHPKYGQEMMGQVHRHNRAGEISAMLILRLQSWRKAGLTRAMDPRVFTYAFTHALHSMAMIEVISGQDVRKPTRPAELRDLVDLFWRGVRADVTGRKSAKA